MAFSLVTSMLPASVQYSFISNDVHNFSDNMHVFADFCNTQYFAFKRNRELVNMRSIHVLSFNRSHIDIFVDTCFFSINHGP